MMAFPVAQAEVRPGDLVMIMFGARVISGPTRRASLPATTSRCGGPGPRGAVRYQVSRAAE